MYMRRLIVDLRLDIYKLKSGAGLTGDMEKILLVKPG